MEGRHLIHAVAFQNGASWVAQCLEFDIATQAPSLDGLMYELQRILVGHVFVARQEKQEPFERIPKAPQRYWEMYSQARTKVAPVRPADLSIPAEEVPEVEVRAA